MRSGNSSTTPIIISISLALVCVVGVILVYVFVVADHEAKITQMEKQVKAKNEEIAQVYKEQDELSALIQADADRAAAASWAKEELKNYAPSEPDEDLLDEDLLDEENTPIDLAGLLRALRKGHGREVDALTQAKDLAEGKAEALGRTAEEKQNAIDRLGSQNSELQKNLDANIVKFNKEMTDSRLTYEQKQATHLAEINKLRLIRVDLNRRAKDAEATAKDLKDQVLILTQTQEPGEDESDKVVTTADSFQADGKIVDVEGDIAIMNLGADDGVKNGMVFLIYKLEGTAPMAKSLGVVRTTDPGSPVSLLKLYRPKGDVELMGQEATNLPVIIGDFVSNPFFMPGRKPKFFLDGAFATTDKWGITLDIKDIERKIIEYGGEIVHQISVDTDYVVLGEEYKTANLEKAQGLSSKIISKADILAFLDVDQ